MSLRMMRPSRFDALSVASCRVISDLTWLPLSSPPWLRLA